MITSTLRQLDDVIIELEEHRRQIKVLESRQQLLELELASEQHDILEHMQEDPLWECWKMGRP